MQCVHEYSVIYMLETLSHFDGFDRFTRLHDHLCNFVCSWLFIYLFHCEGDKRHIIRYQSKSHWKCDRQVAKSDNTSDHNCFRICSKYNKIVFLSTMSFICFVYIIILWPSSFMSIKTKTLNYAWSLASPSFD